MLLSAQANKYVICYIYSNTANRWLFRRDAGRSEPKGESGYWTLWRNMYEASTILRRDRGPRHG